MFRMDDKQEIEIFVRFEMSCLDEDGNMSQSSEEYQNVQWRFYVDAQEITEEDYNAYEYKCKSERMELFMCPDYIRYMPNSVNKVC